MLFKLRQLQAQPQPREGWGVRQMSRRLRAGTGPTRIGANQKFFRRCVFSWVSELTNQEPLEVHP